MSPTPLTSHPIRSKALTCNFGIVLLFAVGGWIRVVDMTIRHRYQRNRKHDPLSELRLSIGTIQALQLLPLMVI
eukprot:2617088-Amphidinium_carterae.1